MSDPNPSTPSAPEAPGAPEGPEVRGEADNAGGIEANQVDPELPWIKPNAD